MAGEFDDLIPNGGKAAVPTGGAFDDLIPAAPAAPDPSQQRVERLRKIALAGMQQQSQFEPAAASLFGDAFTLGLKKPVGAVAGALGGEVGEIIFGGEPASFGERYKAGTQAYDENLAQQREDAGWAGTGAELAGGVLAGRPGAPLAAGWLPTLKSAAGLGAVEGAARNSEDITSAVKGAVEGGGLSALTASAVKGMTDLPSFRQRRAEARSAARGPEPAELKGQSKAIFQRLEDSGIAYSNVQSNDLADAIRNDMTGFDPDGAHAPLKGVLKTIDEMRGQPLTFNKLQDLRDRIGANARDNHPDVRRVAGEMLGAIDGFVTNVQPTLSQIDPGEIAPAWKEARKLWRSANTAEDIGWRMDTAANRAARTNSGANVENTLRQNIGAQMDRASKPRTYNPYNERELDQMRRVSEGTWLGNRLRSFGNTFGGSGPLGMTSDFGGGTVAGLAHTLLGGGDPSTGLLVGVGFGAGLRGTGMAARKASAAMTQNEADKLMRLISTGSVAPYANVPQGPPTREALAQLLAKQSAARGAGVFAAGQ